MKDSIHSMVIPIRDYINGLSESGELDHLLTDLLLNMQIEPLSTPQKGVRQYGVDIAAVGKDPEDGQRKLFLITIKSGNITRSNWDGNPQGVRSSLNEIKDVILNNQIENSYRDLAKKIVLCCGGTLNQEINLNWTGYVNENHIQGDIEYDLWTGEKLALMIEEFFLDEYLFPRKVQELMRKALSHLDQNEIEPNYVYNLLNQILFNSNLPPSKPEKLKTLRLTHLCLCVILKKAADEKNSRLAMLGAERVLLNTWDFLRQHELMGCKSSLKIFFQIYEQYLVTGLIYVKKIHSICFIKDGLVSSSSLSEVIDHPLRVFEVIGLLSTFGINHALLYRNTQKESYQETAHQVADTLIQVIKNNRGSFSPCYDSHAIDITLGLLLLYFMERTDIALDWIKELYHRITLAYQSGDHFPIDSDDYEDLLSMVFDDSESNKHLMTLSTLLPTLAEWYALIGEQQEYSDFRETVRTKCMGVDLQLWYPDSYTESEFFRTNTASNTGNMHTSISLPEDLESLREQMRESLKRQTSFIQMSMIKHSFPILGLIVSRHYRTPVIPAYWQSLISGGSSFTNIKNPMDDSP